MSVSAIPIDGPGRQHLVSRPGQRVLRLVLYVVLYGGALVFLLPLAWMLLTALKTLPENYTFPPALLPKTAQWQNFKTAWTTYDFTLYTYHTLFITVTSMVGVLATSSLCAYGFARLNF